MALVYNGQVVASNTPHVRYTPILLKGAGWDENNKQTVTAKGVFEGTTEQLLTLSSSDEESTNNISTFGLMIVGNGKDTITVSCRTVPDLDINLTLVIIPMKSV